VEIDAVEVYARKMRLLLEDLSELNPRTDPRETNAWRRVLKFVADNPMPPATAGDRDGQRSYGTG
jgi:hypothetical protein